MTAALPSLSQNVGLTLRKLIGSVDSILPSLPASSRTEVSVLVSDSVSGSPSPPPAPAVGHTGGCTRPLGQPHFCLPSLQPGPCTACLSLFHGGAEWAPGALAGFLGPVCSLGLR